MTLVYSVKQPPTREMKVDVVKAELLSAQTEDHIEGSSPPNSKLVKGLVPITTKSATFSASLLLLFTSRFELAKASKSLAFSWV